MENIKSMKHYRESSEKLFLFLNRCDRPAVVRSIELSAKDCSNNTGQQASVSSKPIKESFKQDKYKYLCVTKYIIQT